jgi:thiamine-phosphate pyrophosphorylase
VHLGKNDDSIQQARKQLGINAIIGISCYNDINLAQQAQKQGADYVAFGALFPSPTKPNARQCHLNIITQAQQTLNIPIVGIGGINFNNQQQAFNAGCDSVAIINALFE